jgi:hypothetical protein
MVMTEEEYYASEFSDDELEAAADAGEYFLEEEGFNDQMTDKQIDRLADQGDFSLGLTLPESR